MGSEVVVQLQIVQGFQLPKVGFFDEASGFVRVFFKDELLGETRAIVKCADPIWEENFCFETAQVPNTDACSECQDA